MEHGRSSSVSAQELPECICELISHALLCLLKFIQHQHKLAYFDAAVGWRVHDSEASASLPPTPLPLQKHHLSQKKVKIPTCVQAKLCANCLVKISSKSTAFSHLKMFIVNILQPKICSFWTFFSEKNILKKNLLFYLEPTAPSAAFCDFLR